MSDEFWTNPPDVEIATARALRLAFVRAAYFADEITFEQAKELLCSNLSPDDPTTFFDDSAQLKIKIKT